MPGTWSGVRITVRRGEVLDARVAGWADRGARRPWTVDTASQVASISKQFVAAVTLQLIDEGRLGLDDRIGSMLPDVPASWAAVTVRHLLLHTAGVPHWHDAPGYDPSEDLEPEVRLRLLLAAPPATAPGAAFRYSSPGYIVLGHVLEAAAGPPCARLVRERVVEPLALSRTTVGEQDPPGVALGYAHGDRVPSWPLARMPGTGDIHASAPDLARFVGALHDGTLLGPGGLALLHGLRSPTDAPRSSGGIDLEAYGPGHFLGTVAGRPAGVIPGDDPGFRALAVHLPEEELTVVALTNDEQDDLDPVVVSAVRAALDPLRSSS